MKFRYATPEDDDRHGFSDPRDCRICHRFGHFCGGCGISIRHHDGTTCASCWGLMSWEGDDDEQQGAAVQRDAGRL